MHGEIGELHSSLPYTWPLSRPGRTQETHMGQDLLVQGLTPDCSGDSGRAGTVSLGRDLPSGLHTRSATTPSTEALTLGL